MSLNGYIKLFRSLKDWEWYNNDDVKKVFIDILLSVNFKDTSWQGISIKRGQMIIGLEKYAKSLNLSLQQLRTILKKLESTKEIIVKSTNKNTVITLVKFDVYQEEQHENNNQSTNEQQTNNNQSTNNQQQRNNENKEEKENNVKNKEEREKEKALSLENEFLKSELKKAQELLLKAEKEKEKSSEKKEKEVFEVPNHINDTSNLKPYEMAISNFDFSNWNPELKKQLIYFCECKHEKTGGKFGASNVQGLISQVLIELKTHKVELVTSALFNCGKNDWNFEIIYELNRQKKNNEQPIDKPKIQNKYERFAERNGFTLPNLQTSGIDNNDVQEF